ncbi:MAG: transcription-repair coupling factor [Oscillospiraceae bacterium]|nr:transcription-repair coupling factor [Oscillospiraceae bacterium]
MLALCQALGNNPDFQSLVAHLQAGETPVVLSGLSHIQKLHTAAALRRITGRPVCLIYSDEFDARGAMRDLAVLAQEDPYPLPPRDFTFYHVENSSHEWEYARLQTLSALSDRTAGLTVTSVWALIQRTLPPSLLQGAKRILKQGEEHPLEPLLHTLQEFGYCRVHQVESPGQFAVRGGILDVFSPQMQDPIRIEFWGDEIDVMGSFDPETQRRIENCASCTLIPAHENIVTQAMREELIGVLEKRRTSYAKKEEHALLCNTLSEDLERLRENTSFAAQDRYLPLLYPEFTTALDYFSDDTIFLIDDFARLKEVATRTLEQHNEDRKALIESGVLLPRGCDFTLSFSAFCALLSERPSVCLDTFTHSTYLAQPKALLSLITKQIPSFGGNLEVAVSEIRRYIEEGYRTVVLANTQSSAQTLREILARHDLVCSLDYALSALPEPGGVVIAQGVLTAGFEYPHEGLVLITEGQFVTTGVKKRRHAKQSNREKINSYQDLTVGCLVVHELHGVGRFAGLQKIPVDGVEKDYIKILYAGSDALYVPVTQLDMVGKYIGSGEDTTVRLSKLGGTDWVKAKTRAKGAAKELAQHLVKLYAERRSKPGFSFPKDSSWQREFEERFEYDETDDQLRCTAEIKRDMEGEYSMDRLLCGDVGFGKTEVALRAAMKCILGGKQVALLVPTTVLAQQHLLTVKRRFADYPIEIGALTRFNTPAQTRAVLKKMKEGGVDFVIGTHKLLQKNVSFANLGLLIVDEEQRFGVTHKERLKEISQNIDVLTLTATPIPRTLNMALSGIRDMSILEEAPRNRHPVQTYVLEHNWDIIKDAIRREVARGGQVYYLHNRVASITSTAARLKRLIPDIEVGVAHGKMEEAELSEAMQRVIDNEVQVLVCTTIIETGIDIPNVNTIIIEDADHMGLAQLHQIRGRVGRSARHAFAYLTYRPGRILTEVAEKRLTAIREFAEFGAGFKIAMRDLEIRGAGNVLGAEQSGHMMTVGYDLYLKLLEEAVCEETGAKPEVRTECSADFTVSANIPESYIATPELRMDLYRRIASVNSEEAADDLIDEICDRFGEPPDSVLLLVKIALLRVKASRVGISDFTQKDRSLKVTMSAPDYAWISIVCAQPEYKGRILLNAGQSPYLTLCLKDGADVLKTAETLICDFAAAQESVQKK